MNHGFYLITWVCLITKWEGLDADDLSDVSGEGVVGELEGDKRGGVEEVRRDGVGETVVACGGARGG